jgi:hypothetical protein
MRDNTVSNGKRPAVIVQELLGQYVGPFTSKSAVQLFSKQALATEPDAVTREQIPALLEALGPSLRTLLGKASAEKLVEQIRRELGL